MIRISRVMVMVVVIGDIVVVVVIGGVVMVVIIGGDDCWCSCSIGWDTHFYLIIKKIKEFKKKTRIVSFFLK